MKPGAPRAPKAVDSNARSDRELLYPFGHQNDLGHVVLSRPQSSREGRGDAGLNSPTASSAPSPVTARPSKAITPPPPLPLSPCLPSTSTLPEPELLSPRVLTGSVSHLSLQSSRHNSLASSLSDLSYDVAVLERAIRTNDVAKVRKCFEKHRQRFQLLQRNENVFSFAGESGGGGGGSEAGPSTGPSTSQTAKPSKSNEIVTEMEDNPVVFTNALHLAVEWGANDVLRYLLREGVDPNKEGRLPDAYDMSVAGSRSASVSAWGSGCVFCPPSPKNISRDVSPSREGGRIFSRNSSRNVSSESSRCVSPSPCRDRILSTKAAEQGDNRNANWKREAYKNIAKGGDKTDSSNGDQQEGQGPPSEVRPIISVVYCASEERRRSSSARPSAGEIQLSGSSLAGDHKDQDGDWTPGGQQRRMNRRVSWVSSLREPTDRGRLSLAGKLRKQKLRLPRQRSFSLESELELRTVAKRAVGVAGTLASIREARRSISLKSSPLHFPWTFRRESSSAMRESGVFAELRRSSEIFRNILLSIAGREESTPTDDDHLDLEGKDLSFSSLLAAHGRRRSERSVSYSSCSCSDVSIGSETLPRKPLSVNPAISKGLLVVSIEPRGREVTFAEHYTSPQLMTLPPLFLAACRGRCTPVTLLLQHGAKSNFQDSLGNTPVHLAVIQSPTPWDPILDLMEAGGKISLKNEHGISPADLLPPIGRLQQQLVADCWLGLVLEDAAHLSEQSELGAREPGSRSSRLFKKLHEARHHRDKNSETKGPQKNSSGGRIGDSEYSVGTSEGLQTKGGDDGFPTASGMANVIAESKKKLKKKKDKGTKPQSDPDPIKMEWSELSRCLLTLKSIATNEECLDEVLQGCVTHTQSVLKRFQQVPPTTDVPVDPHKCLSSLLHTIILVAVQCHGSREEPKKYLCDVLCTVAQCCLLLATGPHPLQYTAMVAMNKIVDVTVVHRLTKDSREIDGERYGGSQQGPAGASKSRGSVTTTKLSTGVSVKGPFQKSKSKEASAVSSKIPSSGQDLLDVLEPAVGPIVNILHNAVTLYKRTIGSRQICTPSIRRRSCSAHCLQILSARILVFLSHAPAVQTSLVSDAPLRILIAALDATHDPQLLCLVLQILATLALDPAHHKALMDAGVADALPPLLLPADEFFYTNHTTLFARYVKHHAARLLVYLGLHHRSALRVSVFDLITADESTMQSGTLGNEDLFITWTCSTPPPVLGHPTPGTGTLPQIIAMSVESTLIRVLKSLEGGAAPGSPYLREQAGSWMMMNQSPSRNCFSPVLHFRRHSAESRRDSIGGPELDPTFVRIFQACYPGIVHPTLVLRLLLHRLLSTGLALRRWKSCASRASFASAYSGHSGHSIFSVFSGDSRTSRSRASSTDESVHLTLRRRRQVSLTVDCTSGGNVGEGDDGSVLHEMEETMSPTEQEQASSPTKKIGNTIRGIFAKWRSSSQEASVDRAEDSQRLVPEAGTKQRESSIFGLLPLAALRAAASRENLDRTESGSAGNSPTGSTSLISKQGFRFGSLHQKKPPAGRRLSRNRSLDVAPEVTSPKDTPEEEIYAFQRRLQNLPDFLETSVDTPSLPANNPPTSPRPRSTSVPKVTLDAPLPLILPGISTSPPPTSPSSPTLPIPMAAHLLSPSSPVRGFPTSLPQPIPAPPPSPGLLTPHSPKAASREPSPFDDKGSGSVNDRNDNSNSRRSSFSPASSMGRRHDSIFISDMPSMHRSVLLFVEDWINTARPQGKTPVIRELKDFVTRVSSCGPPYLRWADHIRIICPALAAEEESQQMESLEGIQTEYWEMQRIVVSGSLPCSKEEASILAGIQLRLEECWPRSRPPRIHTGPPLPSPAASHHTPNVGGDKTSLSKATDDKDSSSVPLLTDSSGPPRSLVIDAGSGSAGYEELRQQEEIHQPPEELPPVVKRSGMVRAVSLLTTCYSSSEDNDTSFSSSARLEELVPPCFVHAGNMHRLIKEQKRKLFHTSVYESATQLQKLYVQTCRRLPAFGCRLVVVKELLRGKTKKKATRLLGIGPEKIILLDCRTKTLARSQATQDLVQWRAGGGRNHDRLILEFRGTRWSLLVPPVGGGSSCGVSCGHLGTVGGLREAGRALWTLLREMDTDFLQEFTLPRKSAPLDSESSKKQSKLTSVSPNSELEQLEKVLHFPEEVAMVLSETESELFCQVAPLEYLRYVTMDLVDSSGETSDSAHPGIGTLMDRFTEISSWVTHLLVSPPTHDERKAVLSCLVRIAQTAWNIGAFGSAMEIVAGLKSRKLKPFWLSLSEKEENIATLDNLSKALTGETSEGSGRTMWNAPEYDAALQRALKIPTCPVVPFFGAYIRELRNILSTASLVVLSTGSEQQQLQSLLDPEGDDDYFTRIGSGGLLNMNKLRKVQGVLEKINSIHQHHNKRLQKVAFLNMDRLSIHTSSIERCGVPGDGDSEDSEDDLYSASFAKSESETANGQLGKYNPVQAVSHDPGVSFIPLSGNKTDIDLHHLQILHHGTTALHVDAEGRAAFVWVKLEKSCATVTWSKPVWSSLRFSHAQPDFLLSVDPQSIPIVPGLLLKYGGSYGGSSGGAGSGVPLAAGGLPDVANNGLEEGYIDLNGVKEVESGSKDVDITAATKRFGIDNWSASETCISLVFGVVLSDNRSTFFVFPPRLAKIWLNGLRSVVRALRRVLGKPDRRVHWLKEQYLQLYFEDGKCLAPTIADAIRVFGGRRWSSTITQGVTPETPPFRRTASAKFRKKRSLANIHMIRESFIRGGDQTEFRPPSPASKPRSEAGDTSIPSTPSHQPQSLVRIKSATSMLPSTSEASYQPSRASALTHEARLTFQNFVQLYQAFSLRSRKDLRDLFDSIATSQRGGGDGVAAESSQPESPERSHSSSTSGTTPKHSGKLNMQPGIGKHESKFIYDAIASASIVQNGAGVETSRSKVISLPSFANFLKTHQGERKSEAEVIALIEKFEPDETLRAQNCLSFEGFALYMMSGQNLTFVSEKIVPQEEDMDHPMSHYYVAASHNTYLTGHQLKGESSVELYSQALLTGCRCVELDCWDGDDGDPVIYHGHTFTTKIPFRQVVEAINKSAFLASSFPVILSIENHCSLQQQGRMAWTFQTVFGDKLITRFMFETDYSDEPCLPSPAQLKNRILIKNKKLHAEIIPNPPVHSSTATQSTSSSTTNPAARNRSGSRPQSARTNSIVSNVSGGSINDDYSDSDTDYEDDIQDERLVVSRQASEQALPITPRTDSLTSQESSAKTMKKGTATGPHSNQYLPPEQVWSDIDDAAQRKKQSSQIARELSDLVIYIQAIKFRGLTTLSPSSSVRNKMMMQRKNIIPPVGASPVSLPVTPTSINTSGTTEHHSRRVITNHPVYQCCSLNENASKKLCRKQPLQVLAHTETQLIRAYPAGMRIDSSNFNPLMFWVFGVQMVALNYQTEDYYLHINTSMFEQNGRCGYVLKPQVMWDRNHVMYRRFNPLEKEFDGLHTVRLHVTIVSGQFLSPINYQMSPQVEVEVTGIPADFCKQKTRIIPRNAMNPIWNETMEFTIQFRDLAFIRFAVLDGGSGGSTSAHLIAQRVIPVKALKMGYRHIRLRNSHNQSLPVSTLFICTRFEEDGEEIHDTNKSLSKEDSLREYIPVAEGYPSGSPLMKPSVALKRRMFFLIVYGVVPEEPYTVLKVTQDTTAADVINNALQKSGRSSESAGEYVIIEEVARGWDAKEKDLPPTQRVLDPHEKPLQAQGQWKGEGKFILKKTGNDPSSRAWLSSIAARGRGAGDTDSKDNAELKQWGEDENFLVCVHNVSHEIPYAILKVSVRSTAQDIITQAFVKARRLEDPTKFVLVEELEPMIPSTSGTSGSDSVGSFRKKAAQRTICRCLEDDQNVYEVQLKWNTVGKFVLRDRKQAYSMCGIPGSPQSKQSNSTGTPERVKKGIKASTLAKFSKLKANRQNASKSREKARQYLAERQALSLHDSGSHGLRPRKIKSRRSAHSEGETLSDEEHGTDADFKSTVARLKRVSLRKFRVWK